MSATTWTTDSTAPGGTGRRMMRMVIMWCVGMLAKLFLPHLSNWFFGWFGSFGFAGLRDGSSIHRVTSINA
jgi:hypothetical protein